MVLGSETITSKNLIANAVPASYRAGSYDLTIQDFVTPEGRLVDEFLLPPQGMVKVISAEEVHLPSDVIGYVLVKTGLCNEGILSLNIGIVDPGFNGPLQSSLINFGKTEIRLHRGDVFSRISFHHLDAASSGTQSFYSRDEVTKLAKQQVDRFIPPTFLNIAKTAEQAAVKAFSDYKTTMLKWVPLLALSVALLTFLLNFSNMWLLYSYMKPQDQVRTEVLWQQIDSRLKTLETRDTKASEQVREHPDAQKKSR